MKTKRDYIDNVNTALYNATSTINSVEDVYTGAALIYLVRAVAELVELIESEAE